MKNFVQNGKNIDVLASAAYTSGSLVIEGNLVGVAVADIASGATGTIATEGVYAFTKEAAATLVQGDIAYYDSATKKLDATNTNPAVGYVVAVSGDTVHLKISGHKL
jgi:predicted RecA/RadA family phage recombinase